MPSLVDGLCNKTKSTQTFWSSIETDSFVGCPEERHERTCRFARKSSFCQEHALALTPTSTYRQLIICMFICRNLIPSKDLPSNITSWNIIYNANRIFKSWEFHHSHPLPGTSKAITPSVFLPGARVHVVVPGTPRFDSQGKVSHNLASLKN